MCCFTEYKTGFIPLSCRFRPGFVCNWYKNSNHRWRNEGSVEKSMVFVCGFHANARILMLTAFVERQSRRKPPWCTAFAQSKSGRFELASITRARIEISCINISAFPLLFDAYGWLNSSFAPSILLITVIKSFLCSPTWSSHRAWNFFLMPFLIATIKSPYGSISLAFVTEKIQRVHCRIIMSETRSVRSCTDGNCFHWSKHIHVHELQALHSISVALEKRGSLWFCNYEICAKNLFKAWYCET